MVQRIMGRAAASTEVRADDNEETIKTRLATFRTNTNAILNQYIEKTITVSGRWNNIEAEMNEYIYLL